MYYTLVVKTIKNIVKKLLTFVGSCVIVFTKPCSNRLKLNRLCSTMESLPLPYLNNDYMLVSLYDMYEVVLKIGAYRNL